MIIEFLPSFSLSCLGERWLEEGEEEEEEEGVEWARVGGRRIDRKRCEPFGASIAYRGLPIKNPSY